MRSHGFDSSYATSNLVVVEPPSDGSCPREAGRILSSIVFLPVYPELPEGSVERLVAVVAEAG
jgi:hypothetical protein